jgi:hypothetical protein
MFSFFWMLPLLNVYIICHNRFDHNIAGMINPGSTKNLHYFTQPN